MDISPGQICRALFLLLNISLPTHLRQSGPVIFSQSGLHFYRWDSGDVLSVNRTAIITANSLR